MGKTARRQSSAISTVAHRRSDTNTNIGRSSTRSVRCTARPRKGRILIKSGDTHRRRRWTKQHAPLSFQGLPWLRHACAHTSTTLLLRSVRPGARPPPPRLVYYHRCTSPRALQVALLQSALQCAPESKLPDQKRRCGNEPQQWLASDSRQSTKDGTAAQHTTSIWMVQQPSNGFSADEMVHSCGAALTTLVTGSSQQHKGRRASTSELRQSLPKRAFGSRI